MSFQEMQGIAIIGMAGRFPGAPDLNSFWKNLRSGVESITRFDPEHVALRSTFQPGEQRVYARGVLEGVDLFDASFFGFKPREAELMDPQHRVFLETAWEALEHAGYDAERTKKPIGLFAGTSMNTYLLYNLCSSREFIEQVLDNHQIGTHPALLGNDKDFLSTRVSYKLGLKGPSVVIQTACSTSLVAVSMAWQSLMSYQCDMALAGGVSISFPQNRSYPYTEGAMVSSDGHCRAFDAAAQGMSYGAGAGIVVLKRLEDALKDGDFIYAVIRGAAINNDGSAKVSYMAPSIDGQAAAILTAQELAGVDPETITYIEAHGTGTPLGDPIEIAGLTQAFRAGTQKKQFCAIGSVKTNIGHLEAAAGISGLIKTVLALHHKEIPPSLNFNSPNPEIDFDSSPFFVNTALRSWEPNNGPCRAGVSSFGVGGTNAHVVVEEAPPARAGSPSRSQQLLVLSAKTPTALNTMAVNLADHFDIRPDLDLSDAAYTLQNGRKQFAHRRAVVASSTSEAVTRLRLLDPKFTFTGKTMAQDPSIVFMFPGQGAQYLNMGRDLYAGEVVFREAVDHCAEILESHLDTDIRNVLYPKVAKQASAKMQINDTWLAQPAIFVVEYALAKFLISIGIKPNVLIGHSIGEYVAAVLAESFSLDNALSLLSIRARLMQALPPGAMLSVRMGAEELTAQLPTGTSIAAINSPSLCVVSGATEVIKKLKEELTSENVACRFLHTSHAFHSEMMDPMLQEFAASARKIPTQPPKLLWASTSTGKWVNDRDLSDGNYWVSQIRQPVRFSDALDQVAGEEHKIMLEVGPGHALSQLAIQHHGKLGDTIIVPSMGDAGEPQNDHAALLAALGRLWVSGADINWKRFSSGEKRQRIPLPTYPFERQRYWIEPAESGKGAIEFCAPKKNNPIPIQKEQIHRKREADMEIEKQVDVADIKQKWISEKLVDLFEEISGESIGKNDFSLSFLELGFDSLLLTQVSLAIKNKFQIEVAFRQLLEELTNMDQLIAYLTKLISDDILSSELFSENSHEMMIASEVTAKPQNIDFQKGDSSTIPSATFPVDENMRSLFSRQLTVIENQLDILKRYPEVVCVQNHNTTSDIVQTRPNNKEIFKEKPVFEIDPNLLSKGTDSEKKFVGPQTRINKSVSILTGQQKKFLENLAQRYTEKTKKSKEYTERHRPHLSDPRAVSGFSPILKEMVYPVVTRRSKGSHLWDIDGNEYVDWLNGFGSNFFGYSAPFITEAVEAQIKKGIEIGPQHELAGNVAELICQTTRSERAAFCNTGSEAVLGALRIARTVTGRNTVAMFSGAYHGIFDEVINRGTKKYTALPAAPGITRDSVNNILVLDYDDPQSLNVLRQRGKDIAAILVEPVQSRAPEIQPKMFLEKLRKIADQNDAALIFDEIVTGFRTCLGGAQEYFDIKADIATYGKVIAGGWPIGVIAGKRRFMDALDGGHWNYGDDSIPEVGVTYFAGTFVRHPPALAAVQASLTYLIEQGPEFQKQLNRRCTQMVERLNSHLSILGAPIQLRHFASVMKIEFTENVPYEEILFYLLREKNIHVWHHRPCFLTIAHTDEDIEQITGSFIESVQEMQQEEFLPKLTINLEAKLSTKNAFADQPPLPGARLGKDSEGNPAWFIKDPERPGKFLQIGGQN